MLIVALNCEQTIKWKNHATIMLHNHIAQFSNTKTVPSCQPVRPENRGHGKTLNFDWQWIDQTTHTKAPCRHPIIIRYAAYSSQFRSCLSLSLSPVIYADCITFQLLSFRHKCCNEAATSCPVIYGIAGWRTNRVALISQSSVPAFDARSQMSIRFPLTLHLRAPPVPWSVTIDNGPAGIRMQNS